MVNIDKESNYPPWHNWYTVHHDCGHHSYIHKSARRRASKLCMNCNWEEMRKNKLKVSRELRRIRSEL